MMNTDIPYIKKVSGALLWALLLLPLLATTAQAQTGNGHFDTARNTYNEGEYGQAAQQFAGLARDETLDLELRKEALRYLGRAYVAQSLMEEARKAIVDLEGQGRGVRPDDRLRLTALVVAERRTAG